MSTALTTVRITETSPQVYARIGGVLYLIIIVIGFCSEFFVRDKLVVSGDVTGGWATLTAKYTPSLSLNMNRDNWGCAPSRAFRESLP